MLRNLSRASRNNELPPEICLLIVEHAVQEAPNAAVSLLLVSKSINYLVKKYEKSITKRCSQNDETLFYTNMEQTEILASRLPPRNAPLVAFTYPWLAELRCRSDTIDFLMGHELTQMEDRTDDWPTLEISRPELDLRLTIFKRNAFLLLYRLADCAIGLDGTKNIRARQSVFLEKLYPSELATLGILVEVMGHRYFSMTKKALHSSEQWDVLLAAESSASHFFAPSPSAANDAMNDQWVRECMCVFEDLVQRHGPYFAWAYLGEEPRVRKWARSELQQGLNDMNAFELGYTMSFASLQSVVWRIFCKKVHCNIQDSWTSAKEMIELEMAEYED